MTQKGLVFNSFASKVLAALCGVISVIVTSRWLGAEIRGEISYLLSWMGTWVIASDFVSGSALINLSAKNSVKQLWRFSVSWSIALAIFAFGFYWIFPMNKSAYYMLIPVAILLMGFYNTNGALLIGKGKLNARNYSFTSIAFLSLIGLLSFALVKGSSNLGTVDYFICLLSAWFIAGLTAFLFIRKFFKEKLQIHSFGNLAKLVFKTGALSQAGNMAAYASARLPYLILPIFFGMEELGVFSNAIVLAEGVLIISASLGQILHYKVINLDDPSEYLDQLKKYVKTSVLLVIPATLILIFIPDSFWIWLLKKEFSGLGKLFLVLSPMILFQSVSAIISHFYHAANRFVVLIWANSIGAIFGLASYFVLSGFFGINGFAIGVVAGYFFQFIFLLVRLNKDYKIKPYSLIPDVKSVREVVSSIKIKKPL